MRPVVERVGDRFRLEREIGSGGMSTVYLGRDEVLDRSVAVKILRGGFGESEDVGSRFEREGRTAARLSHANIVQVYDAGKDENADRDVSYIVMEYISGGDLKNMMDKDGPLSGKQLSRIGAEVAAGLAHAHERGVVHRDIKPQNVLMDEYGRPKLTDFGIARALDGTVHTTKTGSYLGTALYSSPEQLKGEEITAKSDVYSLGVTLYHATVGEPPFSGGPIEVATQQMTQEPESPRQRGAKITPDMERLILSCLSKNPDDRPTSAELETKLLQAGAVAQRNPELYGDGAAGAGGLAGVAGAAESAVRDKFGGSQSGSGGGGSRNPRRIDGRPTETVSLPTRTFQSGARDRGLLVLAAAALLFIVFIAAGAWALTNLGGGDGEAADSPGGAAVEQPETPDGAGASGGGDDIEADDTGAPDEGGASGEENGDPQNGDAQNGDAQNGDAQNGDAQNGDPQNGDLENGDSQNGDAQESDPGPPPPAAEAEAVVLDMYVASATGEIPASWDALSSRYQDEIGSIEAWESEAATNGVFFTSLPQATLDGDNEARVSFTAQETRDGAQETVSGTWIAVNEDGEWKLDRLE